MECEEVREQFPAFDEETFSPAALEHLGSCDSCRSELAEYRALEANLGSLASVEIQPPAWLLGAVTEKVGQTLRRRARIANAGKQLGTVTTRQLGEHRVAAGSALGLAVLAGAVLFGRSRRSGRVAGVKVA